MRISKPFAAFVAKTVFAAVALAALVAVSPAAKAGFFDKIKKGVTQAANTVASETTNAANTVATETTNAANVVASETTNFGREVGQQAKSAGEKAAEQIKNNAINQHSDLMRDTAENWKSLITDNENDINGIAQAMKDNDGQEAGRRIVNLLTNNGGLRHLINNAKEKRFGSVIFMTSASAAAGVGASGAVGEAISIDALIHFFQHGSFPEGQVSASYFAAGGLTVGASGGGSADIAIGFAFAQPDGMGGPSLDLNAELNLVVGGNTCLSFDPTGGINLSGFAIGASGGAKFDLSGGVSYTQLLLKIYDPLNAAFGQ